MSAGTRRSTEHQPPAFRCTPGSSNNAAQKVPTVGMGPSLAGLVVWLRLYLLVWASKKPEFADMITWSLTEAEVVSLHLHCTFLQRCLWWLMLTTTTVMEHSLPKSVTMRFQGSLTAATQASMATFSFCVEELWWGGQGGLTFIVDLQALFAPGRFRVWLDALLWQQWLEQRCFGSDDMLQACNLVGFLWIMFLELVVCETESGPISGSRNLNSCRTRLLLLKKKIKINLKKNNN